MNNNIVKRLTALFVMAVIIIAAIPVLAISYDELTDDAKANAKEFNKIYRQDHPITAFTPQSVMYDKLQEYTNNKNAALQARADLRNNSTNANFDKGSESTPAIAKQTGSVDNNAKSQTGGASGTGTVNIDTFNEGVTKLVNEKGISTVKYSEGETVIAGRQVGTNAGAPLSLFTVKDANGKITQRLVMDLYDGGNKSKAPDPGTGTGDKTKKTVAGTTAKPGATQKPGTTAKPTKTDKPGTTPKPGTTQKPGTTPNPSGAPVNPEPTCYDYEEPVYAPDFAICEVVPLLVKKDQRVLVAVNVVNNGSLDAETDVSVTIGTERIEMTNISMPAYGCHTLSFGHYTPKTLGKQKITVTVNPSHPGEVAPHTITCNTCLPCDPSISWNGPLAPQEYGYGDNTWSGSINEPFPKK